LHTWPSEQSPHDPPHPSSPQLFPLQLLQQPNWQNPLQQVCPTLHGSNAEQGRTQSPLALHSIPGAQSAALVQCGELQDLLRQLGSMRQIYPAQHAVVVQSAPTPALQGTHWPPAQVCPSGHVVAPGHQVPQPSVAPQFVVHGTGVQHVPDPAVPPPCVLQTCPDGHVPHEPPQESSPQLMK
jgi:hypothetical protein